MFKLNAYSTGKLPLTLCLCRNSIRIIADATVCRALLREHCLVPPRRSSGSAGAQPCASASSISGQAARWRQEPCVILTNMDRRRARSSVAVSAEQLACGGASSSFPPKWGIVRTLRDTAERQTQFGPHMIRMIWNGASKFKLQIPFPTNFVSSPEENVKQRKWIK